MSDTTLTLVSNNGYSAVVIARNGYTSMIDLAENDTVLRDFLAIGGAQDVDNWSGSLLDDGTSAEDVGEVVAINDGVVDQTRGGRMTPVGLADALAALGWSGRHLASLLGCHRDLTTQWLSGRVAVPDRVAAWLKTLVAAHARHPAPTDWRVRSAA